MTLSPAQLLGRWKTDPEDIESIREQGLVSLDFQPNGDLTYTVHGERSDQVMLLTYKLVGDTLVTNQPSAPREERTPIRLTAGGKLIVLNGKREYAYTRPASTGRPGDD